jgi:Heparinase II/III-like protein
LLDFALYAFGTPVALEAIHWGSYDNPLDHYLRSPQAHNQVVVNDAPLDWVNCQREEVVWVTGQGLDYFLAQHRGYTQAFGVTIQRQVLFLKPDYFLVSDTIFAGPQHQSYTWYLHSPYKWQVGKTRCVTMAHPGLQVIPAQLAEIRHIRRGTAYEARDGAPGPYANRYWIGLQKWMTGAGEAAVLYDIALVPFPTLQIQLKSPGFPSVSMGATPVPKPPAASVWSGAGRLIWSSMAVLVKHQLHATISVSRVGSASFPYRREHHGMWRSLMAGRSATGDRSSCAPVQ